MRWRCVPRPTNEEPVRIGFAPGHAAPHHRATPVDRRLRGMHLSPHGRVDAIGADQQRALASEVERRRVRLAR